MTRADCVRFLKLVFPLLLALTLANCGEAENKNTDHVKQGIEYTNQQEYDKAVESFLKAIEKNPKNPEGYYGLGGMYNYKKMFPEAEQAFKTAIRLDPTHFNAHYSLGFTYELMGKKDESEKEYQRYKDLKKKFDALSEEDLNKR
jgi:Tfp pilus assembly protein PilF